MRGSSSNGSGSSCARRSPSAGCAGLRSSSVGYDDGPRAQRHGRATAQATGRQGSVPAARKRVGRRRVNRFLAQRPCDVDQFSEATRPPGPSRVRWRPHRHNVMRTWIDAPFVKIKLIRERTSSAFLFSEAAGPSFFTSVGPLAGPSCKEGSPSAKVVLLTPARSFFSPPQGASGRSQWASEGWNRLARVIERKR